MTRTKKKISVLIIENDEVSAKLMLHMVLAPTINYEIKASDVCMATNITQGLEHLMKHCVDIVLLDLDLPDSSGIDTFEVVRKSSPSSAVIVMVNAQQEECGANAIDAGAHDYLVKGEYDAAMLNKSMMYALRQAHVQSTVQQTFLEEQVAERTMQYKKSKERAEQANKAKTEFLSNMSHEIRTPLHGILNFSKFGMDKIDVVDKEKILNYFTEINESAQRLLHLVDNLLDLSKIEAGHQHYVFSPTHLKEVVETVVHELESYAKERSIVCDCQCECQDDVAELDQEKIMQVVRNLVVNAIKFSPKGATVVIRMSADETTVSCAIIDVGIGVPHDEMHVVFDKFVQSSKTKKGAEGTGLGLAIAHAIISDHHGRIWAQSNPAGGSIFTFVVPRTQPEHKKLGEILVDKGVITLEELQEGLNAQGRHLDDYDTNQGA